MQLMENPFESLFIQDELDTIAQLEWQGGVLLITALYGTFVGRFQSGCNLTMAPSYIPKEMMCCLLSLLVMYRVWQSDMQRRLWGFQGMKTMTHIEWWETYGRVDSSVVDMLDNIQIGIPLFFLQNNSEENEPWYYWPPQFSHQYEDGMQWRTGAENPMMTKECTKKGWGKQSPDRIWYYWVVQSVVKHVESRDG